MSELGEQNLGWVEQKCLILLKYFDLVKKNFTWLLCILIWLKKTLDLVNIVHSVETF